MLEQGFVAERPRLRFRSTSSVAGTTALTKPASVAVGDVVVVMASAGFAAGATTLTTSTGSAWSVNTISWTSSTGGTVSQVFWKVLDATDVANAWSFAANRDAVAVAYIGNGATAVTVKSTKDDSASTASSTSLTGYTPAPFNRGMVTAITKDAVAPAFVAPTNATIHGSQTGGVLGQAIADNADYVGGTITWGVASGSGEVSWALEAA